MQLTELCCKARRSMGGTPNAIAQNWHLLAVQSPAFCCLPFALCLCPSLSLPSALCTNNLTQMESADLKLTSYATTAVQLTHSPSALPSCWCKAFPAQARRLRRSYQQLQLHGTISWNDVCDYIHELILRAVNNICITQMVIAPQSAVHRLVVSG